jgi:hypothetical protein
MKTLHSPRVSFTEVENGTAHILCDNGAHYTWHNMWDHKSGILNRYWKELAPVPGSVRWFELEQGGG